MNSKDGWFRLVFLLLFGLFFFFFPEGELDLSFELDLCFISVVLLLEIIKGVKLICPNNTPTAPLTQFFTCFGNLVAALSILHSRQFSPSKKGN